MAHFQEGHTHTEIARFLKVSRGSINKRVTNYLRDGLSKLDSVRPSGRLQGTDIQKYIEATFVVIYELSNIYRLLIELGFSWITSRSRHPKQGEQAQSFLKNKFPQTTHLSIPSDVVMANVDVWFQGESVKYDHTAVGPARQPSSCGSATTAYVHLSLSIGVTEALLTPLVNRGLMKQHLGR